MLRWLRFWRSGPSQPPKEAGPLNFTADQIDLPSPELRQIMVNYVNSGTAVFGVDDGSTGEIAVLGTGEFVTDPKPDPPPAGRPEPT